MENLTTILQTSNQMWGEYSLILHIVVQQLRQRQILENDSVVP